MSKFKLKSVFLVFITCLFVVSLQSISAQESSNDSIAKFTIDNCVNQFSMDQTIETKVGYQYWFADKEFIDGRTLKMSVVAPHKSTHAPHKHIEDGIVHLWLCMELVM